MIIYRGQGINKNVAGIEIFQGYQENDIYIYRYGFLYVYIYIHMYLIYHVITIYNMIYIYICVCVL